MKVTINVECTPEEARRYMGLPDVTAFNDQILDNMADKMTNMGPESFMTAYEDLYKSMTSYWTGKTDGVKKK